MLRVRARVSPGAKQKCSQFFLSASYYSCCSWTNGAHLSMMDKLWPRGLEATAAICTTPTTSTVEMTSTISRKKTRASEDAELGEDNINYRDSPHILHGNPNYKQVPHAPKTNTLSSAAANSIKTPSLLSTYCSPKMFPNSKSKMALQNRNTTTTY